MALSVSLGNLGVDLGEEDSGEPVLQTLPMVLETLTMALGTHVEMERSLQTAMVDNQPLAGMEQDNNHRSLDLQASVDSLIPEAPARCASSLNHWAARLSGSYQSQFWA
jgi:hypothetical protein